MYICNYICNDLYSGFNAQGMSLWLGASHRQIGGADLAGTEAYFHKLALPFNPQPGQGKIGT
jgi:hypothetical protein